jgi:hypothetical protein
MVITRLLKSQIRVSVLVVRATHHSPGWQKTLPVYITLSTRLSISMWLDGPLEEVLVNKVRFGKMICRRSMVG